MPRAPAKPRPPAKPETPAKKRGRKPTDDPKITTGIALRQSLREALRAEADRRDISVSELVDEPLSAYVDNGFTIHKK